MYQLRTTGGKRDPVKRWGLPDRVFFACGACHILAYAFLRAYPNRRFAPIWIRPAQGFTGNHIVVVSDNLAFDYHGYSDWRALLAHYWRHAQQRLPGWDAALIQLPEQVLISNSESRRYDSVWLMEHLMRCPAQKVFETFPRSASLFHVSYWMQRLQGEHRGNTFNGLVLASCGFFLVVEGALLHQRR